MRPPTPRMRSEAVFPYVPLLRFPDAFLGIPFGLWGLCISAPQHQSELPPPRSTGHPAADRTLAEPKKTFLIVDDEPAVADVLSILLEDSGISCLTAMSAAAALQVYAQHQGNISAVITDLHMPEMDGIGLANALREISPTLKIVIMTGSRPPGWNDGLNIGAEKLPLLLKPFSKRELLDCVKALCV
jgi:CheY-like chemotaxis protein